MLCFISVDRGGRGFPRIKHIVPAIFGQECEVIFEEVRAGTICKFENDVQEDRVRKRLAEEALEAVGWRQETTTTQRSQGCELHTLRIHVRLPAARAAHVAKELRAREMVICHGPRFGIQVHVATERNISTAAYKMMREFGALQHDAQDDKHD